jgi:hypothetical protein
MIFGGTSNRVLDYACVMYRKITNKNDIVKLQKVAGSLTKHLSVLVLIISIKNPVSSLEFLYP